MQLTQSHLTSSKQSTTATETQTQYKIVFSVWGCTEREIKREGARVFMRCETDETSKPVCGRQKNEGSVGEASFHRNTSVAFGGSRRVDTESPREVASKAEQYTAVSALIA